MKTGFWKKGCCLLIALSMLWAQTIGLADEPPGEGDPPQNPPTEETTPPAEETTPPAEETTPPPEETTPPAEKTTPPAEETTPPAEETTPPAEETTPPAEETTPPAEETTPPAATTPPAEETTPPAATETPEPTETTEPTETPPPMFEVNENGVLTAYHGFEQHSQIVIPDGVRVIDREVFKDDTVIQTVVLPDSVEEIREMAFYGCKALKTVAVTSESRLTRIESKAFRNCGKIDREFAASVTDTAPDAFDDLPPTPTPTPTPVPTPTPTPTPTPEPTPDPYEEIIWAPSGGGRGSGGKRQTHGRSRTEMKHDYDQVRIVMDSEPQLMHTLTLDGEKLDVTLADGAGNESVFTVSLYGGLSTEGALIPGEQKASVMLLSAEGKPEGDQAEKQAIPESVTWEMNGAALRVLHKSGIEYLVFRHGKQYTAVPTEGFLAGWAYDELKSRGTAGRRFEYTLTMDTEEAEPRWTVTVEGKKYEIEEDPLAAMYLKGIETWIGEKEEEPKTEPETQSEEES